VYINDTYFTIKHESEGFYKEKGSKFLAFAYPVQDEAAVKERTSELKKLYYDARHHCYAYILGYDGEQYRASDDGEPNHSAGDPILGQIKSNNLTNTLIVVVRYFGGTKLGISGLINAYKTAAADALSNNRIITKLITQELKLQFDYPQMNLVMKYVKDFDLEIIDQKLELTCEMTIGVRMGREGELRKKISEIQGISIIEKSV
jgi:uncharacterized YigZ family protein